MSNEERRPGRGEGSGTKMLVLEEEASLWGEEEGEK